jgi:ActR/RegA family two-component response regulator
MKRFRLSTLLLLVIIAALCNALFVQQKRAAQRETELRTQAVIHKAEVEIVKWRHVQQQKAIQDLLIESQARMIDMHKQLYKQRGDDGKK